MRQGNSSGQVAHTHVLLSPSSIIWCREVQCRLKTSEDIAAQLLWTGPAGLMWQGIHC